MKTGWACIVIFLLVGCADNTMTRSNPSSTNAPIHWPEAPDRARIRYLYTFESYKDLGLRLPMSGRFRDLITGGDVRILVRPYAIAVDDGLIVIADPGIAVVHVFDIRRDQYRRIKQVNKVQFSSPIGVSLADDRIFITDSALEMVYILDRKLDLIATISGLERPTSLAWDPVSEKLFVSETLAHRLQVYDRNGSHLATIGKRGTGPAEFNFPTHLMIKSERIIINDTMNFRVQILGVDGGFISSFGEHGDASGYFSQPKGVAVDSQDHVYIAEAINNRIQIFELDGTFMMDFGGNGDLPGNFLMPAGIAFYEDTLYVCDSRNGRVQVFEYLGED